ncbi:hypothetical protein IAT38_004189 [Cryptococcus sp. DSM 104549]
MISTSIAPKARRRRLYLEAPPPYMSPMPRARVGFNDLPMEVVERIMSFSKTFYGLLLACKRTCTLAGELLYANGPVVASNYPSLGPRLVYGLRMRPPSLWEVLRGLEGNEDEDRDFYSDERDDNDGVCPGRPFGNKLKRRFMRKMKELRYTAMSPVMQASLPMATRQMMDEEVEALRTVCFELIECGLKDLFTDLKDLTLNCKHRKEENPDDITGYEQLHGGLLLAIASLSRPQVFEWGVYQIDRIGDTIIDLIQELRFAGGHLPLVVLHHIHHRHSLPLDKHPVPFPCYGTHNIVHMTNILFGDETVSGINDYIYWMLQGHHAEEDYPTLGEVLRGSGDLGRREVTTWEFSWSSPDLASRTAKPMEALEEYLEEIWEGITEEESLYRGGRVMVSSPDIWRKVCSSGPREEGERVHEDEVVVEEEEEEEESIPWGHSEYYDVRVTST